MGIELPLYDLIIIILALFVGGVVKGVLGMGMPVVAVPIIAGFLGVEHSVIVMTIPGIIFNGWLVWQQRKDSSEIPEMPRLLLSGAVGAALGAWVLHVANENFLSIALALWIGVYITIRFLHPHLTFSLTVRMKISPLVGALAGIFQGSMGICSPVLATYLNAVRLHPAAFVFAISAPFLILALTQFFSYLVLGMYDTQLFIESGLAVIPGIIAMPLGVRMRKHINRKIFDWMVLIMISLIGIKLVIGVVY